MFLRNSALLRNTRFVEEKKQKKTKMPSDIFVHHISYSVFLRVMF